MSNPVRIFVAGDFCCKPSTSLLSVSEELRRLLQTCDIRICNFEFPLLPDGFNPPKANFQNDDTPDFLKDLGFNLFTLANNHTFDCGKDGFLKTSKALEGKTIGAGDLDEAYRPKIIESDGKRIAFLGLCYAAKEGVLDSYAEDQHYGSAYLYDNKVNHIIINAKKEVDYLIVMVHDGMEYVDIPLPDTITRYRDLIDYGADAVIGTHPHCPQGWECYQGKPIFYSLGNFFFNSKGTTDTHTELPHWYEGLCVVLELEDHGIHYEVVNTLNQNNTSITIEHSSARDSHNQQLCRYLEDHQAYQNYLQSSVFPILQKQDYLILDASVHRKPFSKTLGIWFHRLGHLLTGRRHINDERMVNLLKNDARRNILLRLLKNNTNK